MRNDPAVGGVAKRTIDVSLAAIALLALLPLLIGLYLLIKLQMPGPFLYGHERIGHSGRRFRCWKLRTMHVDGDEILRKHIANDSSARAEWLATRKLRDDPRVTPLGQVLRAYSLDELPQFFNVIAGDMSLVGPRPVVSEELDRYGSSRRYYLMARPGVTGLWQISGRTETSYSRRIAFDRYYTARRNIGLDIVILVKTVPAVVASRGAY
ncbi:sugar transferase [Loktanella sp. SALINAS62]|nr:sugar transferase [Loktanella sp. SALINAS62]